MKGCVAYCVLEHDRFGGGSVTVRTRAGGIDHVGRIALVRVNGV